jgi:hypothetical protein
MPEDYIRPIFGVTLDVMWPSGVRPEVDYGGVMPAGVLADKLLGTDPNKFPKTEFTTA